MSEHAGSLISETRIALEAVNFGIESLIARSIHAEELQPLANLSKQACEAFETLAQHLEGTN